MRNMALDGALYTYAFGPKPVPELSCRMEFAGGILSASRHTEIALARDGERALLLIGFYVDAFGEISREELPARLLREAQTVDGLLNGQNRLAGRYLILYRNKEALYALGDASSSIGAYYCDQKGGACVASLPYLAARICNCAPDPLVNYLRLSVSKAYPLPADRTDYLHLRCLLPNHCLDMRAGSAFRYFPAESRAETLTPERAAEALKPLLISIARQYAESFPFALPLTAGWDSRLTAACFLRANPAFPAFTLCRTPASEESAADEAIAPRIAERLGVPHRHLPYAAAPYETREFCRFYLGEDFSDGLADWPEMFRAAFPGRALYGGAIIDQLGKCGFVGKHIPEAFATAAYFSESSGFCSETGRSLNRAFVSEMKKSGYRTSAFDLYAWEWYCGRWGNRHTAVYSLLGIQHLNIYNCRAVIELLLRVPRRDRLRRKVHQALYAALAPELAELPFNPASARTRLRRRLGASALNQMLGIPLRYAAKRIRRRVHGESAALGNARCGCLPVR